MTATIHLNKAHYPVTVLGPGTRIGLWTQGCSIRCHGCSAQDTWLADDATRVAIRDVLTMCDGWLKAGATGVTISGGEPFDQPEALRSLVAGLRALAEVREVEIDILCYSGRSWQHLQAQYADIVSGLDAVISEPYVRGRPTSQPWRGSDNQRLHLLTDRARQRFTVNGAAPARLQVAVDDESIWMIGVPQPGDLDRVESRLSALGVILEDVSWRN